MHDGSQSRDYLPYQLTPTLHTYDTKRDITNHMGKPPTVFLLGKSGPFRRYYRQSIKHIWHPMTTITLTEEGFKRIVNQLAGTTPKYRQEHIEKLFQAQEAITNGRY